MKLNNLRDNAGAVKNRNRVGRGMATGNGKTAGSGHKGQKARAGTGKNVLGFEGGQNPLYKRLPMRGFNNSHFTKTYATINIADLQFLFESKRISANDTINIETLQNLGVTKKAFDGLKVLGSGEISVKLNLVAAAASKSAIEKIEKAGGKVTLPAAKVKVKRYLPKDERK